MNRVNDRPYSTFPAVKADSLGFNRPTAAYIHIPFCRRRCYYCDFPISVVGDRPPLSRYTSGDHQHFGTIAEYVEMLCQEIATTPAWGETLETVFFGGGTPSLLSVEQLGQILKGLDQQFGIATQAEISMEMDPGTFDLAYLQGYVALGVNRVSLGVQAFQPEILAACGRTHTPADIEAAIELIHQVGVTNFSLDLISGLPYQTLDLWQSSLEAAIALSPTHLSIYDLTIEPRTAFDRWYQPGSAPLPSDETTAQMYRLAQQVLTNAGYEHYEISNYARSGYQCRHNRVYWENRSYYGFGMGAASYVNGQRFTRPRKRSEYYQWVQAFKERQGTIDCLQASWLDRLLDQLMLGLRLADGVSVGAIVESFGAPVFIQILSCLQPAYQRGWVEMVDRSGHSIDRSFEMQSLQLDDRIRLTDPEGFLFSNVVLTRLFQVFSESND